MKIALYLRVSTDKQETDNQALQLRDFAPVLGSGRAEPRGGCFGRASEPILFP
jgi:DNA invertase Pin-like site-specific DNA recombinase